MHQNGHFYVFLILNDFWKWYLTAGGTFFTFESCTLANFFLKKFYPPKFSWKNISPPPISTKWHIKWSNSPLKCPVKKVPPWQMNIGCSLGRDQTFFASTLWGSNLFLWEMFFTDKYNLRKKVIIFAELFEF